MCLTAWLWLCPYPCPCPCSCVCLWFSMNNHFRKTLSAQQIQRIVEYLMMKCQTTRAHLHTNTLRAITTICLGQFCSGENFQPAFYGWQNVCFLFQFSFCRKSSIYFFFLLLLLLSSISLALPLPDPVVLAANFDFLCFIADWKTKFIAECNLLI